MLEDLTSIIFNKLDNPVLEKQYEDGFEIEPTCYAPIIPMILVNGATGIGTGYSTDIPCFNPVDVIENIKLLLENQKNGTNNKLKKMHPYYHNFSGKIKKLSNCFINSSPLLSSYYISTISLPMRIMKNKITIFI